MRGVEDTLQEKVALLCTSLQSSEKYPTTRQITRLAKWYRSSNAIQTQQRVSENRSLSSPFSDLLVLKSVLSE